MRVVTLALVVVLPACGMPSPVPHAEHSARALERAARESQEEPVARAAEVTTGVVTAAVATPVLGVPLPIGEADTGNAVALARVGPRSLAYVADEDDGVVRTIDLDARVELAATPAGGAPAALLVLPDGRVAVTLADRGQVALFEPSGDATKPLVLRASTAVAAEPEGLATTPDGATLLVVSRWAHTLTALDARTLAVQSTRDLGRDPRAVVASSDGRKAFIAHLAGPGVTVVDLDRKTPPRRIDLRIRELHDEAVWVNRNVTPYTVNNYEHARMTTSRDLTPRGVDQGSALVRAPNGRILAPEALVDTGGTSATEGYGVWRGVVEDIAVVRERDELREAAPLTHSFRRPQCVLPRAAALDPVTGHLLVACAGTDTVESYDLAARQEGKELWRDGERSWTAGAGPTGLAVDGAARRAVVWSQFAHGLGLIELGHLLQLSPHREVDLDGSAESGHPRVAAWLPIPRSRERDPLVDEGRRLFHATADQRISMDGRACASCHPDARDDGLTWRTPEGPRQTPMLLGRLEGTAPYGWDGGKPDLMSHLDRTLERLRGRGLPEEPKRALLAYVASLKAPVTFAPPSELAARGDALFHEAATGCSSCHLGDDALTDHARHDVRSHAAGDKSAAFDTPSLRFVGHSAPYFHDGRFPTLARLLRATSDTMGHTSQLIPEDRAALAAYLESL